MHIFGKQFIYNLVIMNREIFSLSSYKTERKLLKKSNG